VRIVIDASAAVNVVMRTAAAPGLIQALEPSELVLAPALYHAEVSNALWRYVRGGAIDKATAVARLEEARAIVDAFESDEPLCTEALALALRHGHPVYDFLYIVAAMRTGARLLTTDTRLAELAARIDPSLI
jgi:predicted nucleic acid-binding protein